MELLLSQISTAEESLQKRFAKSIENNIEKYVEQLRLVR